MGLEIVFTVDCEALKFLEQGAEIYTGVDRLKFEANKLFSPFRYNKDGFFVIYNFCVQYGIPVTFMLLGEKYRPLELAPPWVEWGYHTFSHKRLTKCTQEELDAELTNIYQAKSFTAPGWETNPYLDKIIRSRYGYRIMTTRGPDNNRLMSEEVVKPRHVQGVMPAKLWVSACMRDCSKPEVDKIIKSVEHQCVENERKNNSTVFCISAHDFIFDYSNIENFDYLYHKLMGFKWVKMGDLI